jgi:hypothetical protein
MITRLGALAIGLALGLAANTLLLKTETKPRLVTDQEPGPAKPLYEPTGTEGTITGTVAYSGKLPKRALIDSSADPTCGKLVPGLFKEDTIVTNGKLANVFVYLKGEKLATYSFEPATSLATLSHKNCRYQPHTLAIRVGQWLAIANQDPTTHNTHAVPRLNPEWNQTRAAGSEPLIVSFKREELFVPLKDNLHPWEKAYIGVFSHPFFAVSDEQGGFRITGVPPGRYLLVAWHELFGEQTTEITIAPGQSSQIDFSFRPATDSRSGVPTETMSCLTQFD